METTTAKPLRELLPPTLAMLESPSGPQTTEKLPDEKRKRTWLDKWLRLRSHHPQLRELENEVYRFCVAFGKHPGRGYRLIIHGENGTGKSHSARAICRWAQLLATRLPIVATSNWFGSPKSHCVLWPEICTELKEGRWTLLNDLVGTNLLCLDDVGAEHDTTGFAKEKLCWLLERREFMWTVLTTNIKPEEWSLRFERRIASRLIRNSRIVSLDQVPDFSSL